MNKLKEMLLDEIEAVENKGKLDYNLLDMVGKVVDVVKDIHEIECMDRKLEAGYSGHMPQSDRGYYIEPHYYSKMYRDSEPDDKYHKMMEEAKSEEERELIRRLMEVRK